MASVVRFHGHPRVEWSLLDQEKGHLLLVGDALQKGVYESFITPAGLGQSSCGPFHLRVRRKYHDSVEPTPSSKDGSMGVSWFSAKTIEIRVVSVRI